MKTKNLIVSACMLCCISHILAQVTEAEKKLKTLETDTIIGWKTGGVTGVNLAQTALFNWAAGGQSSIAVNGLFSIFANYKSPENAWDNSLDIGYGLLKQGKNSFMKTDDKIDFLSKYGRKAFADFYYTALVNFKTQFTLGYNYPNDSVKISNFLAPAYMLVAVGLNYQPNSYFNAFLAPVTGKLTIVNDDALSTAGAFGVEPGKKSKQEFGGYARIIYSRNDFKSEFLKNVTFTTKIDLFSNYLKDPQNIDVSWENQLALKVNKYITVNLNTQLVYDADVKTAIDTNGDGIMDSEKAKVQFKEILGVGFSYNF